MRLRDVVHLRSLNAKGWAVTLALLGYLLAAGVTLALHRESIDDSVHALASLAAHEKALALTEAAVAGALVDVTEAGSAAGNGATQLVDLRLYMENCTRLFQTLEQFDPRYALLRRGIERGWGSLAERPERANWIDLREALSRAASELDIRRRVLAEERTTLLAHYQHLHDDAAVRSAVLGLVGIVAFGTLAAWFFARMSRDIRALESHARQIVQGRRGMVLPVHRQDELGHLMHAVNQMAADLDDREQRMLLDDERRAHADKMLAIGALAAGVAHEVNNPLAAISGLAQELRAGASAERVGEAAALIEAQVQRAAQSARQLAEVSAPRPADLDWMDLNALLRDAVRLMGYDRRYRRLPIVLDADPALPALRSSEGAVQQTLSQLLGMVGDALSMRDDAAPEIRIETRAEADGASITLQFAPVLDFTRADAQRALLLTRAIVEPLGGRLALGQDGGQGQRIKLRLPIDPSGASE